MKTILVPLDLEAKTLALLDHAVPMAAQTNATLLLLHVIQKQPYDNGTFDINTPVHAQVRREIEVILDQLSSQTFSRGVRSKTLIKEGDPAAVILQYAKEAKVDMIVMKRSCGTYACTSEDVLRAAPCPVLTCLS